MSDETYSPSWAPHVAGTFPSRVFDPQTGGYEPQVIRMTCSACGDEHRVTCESGAVRQHVLTYARVHLHRDPLSPEIPSRR